jgi:hypothetical protein
MFVPPLARGRKTCPCGSGKKYKRCCMAGDEERLPDSLDISTPGPARSLTVQNGRRLVEDHADYRRTVTANVIRLLPETVSAHRRLRGTRVDHPPAIH